jgi:hypothetical protein
MILLNKKYMELICLTREQCGYVLYLRYILNKSYKDIAETFDKKYPGLLDSAEVYYDLDNYNKEYYDYEGLALCEAAGLEE